MKKYLSLLLSLIMILSAIPFVNADEVIATEKCGDNLTWTVKSYNTLIISGTGPAYDYASWG